MIHYKLLVVHWSTFTLSVQLIYCASLHSTRDSVMTSAGSVGLSSITMSPIYKSSQLLSHQSICYAETEHVLSVNGKESSIVKLLKFRSKPMRNPNSHIDAGGVSLDVNETTTCPLNIMMGTDPLTQPWKLDPCKMEANGINKEIVRLTEGLLRISWTPNRHAPTYKLIITTLGKGYHCNQGKHPCMKYGQETLFCVSSSLVCDGVNHCPSGEEYNSDEDPNMCARQRGLTDSNSSFGFTIWQQISKEFFSKLYPNEHETTTVMPPKSPKPTATMHKKSSGKDDNGSVDEDSTDDDTPDGTVESSTTKHYHHMTLSRGLSKYGALLVCVLWECCCKSDKTPLLTTLDTSNISTITGSSSNANFNGTQPETTLPPNYDEIDPPPSYATLFPGNKITDESSSTAVNSSIDPSVAVACRRYNL